MAAASDELTARLPRLAIVGDILIEQTAGGALLLYRLLQNYPPDRLLIVSNAAMQRSGDSAKRLPGVRHASVPCVVSRTMQNRMFPAWPVALPRMLRRPVEQTLEAIREFAPEALLTIPYDFYWLAASQVARRLQLPLHLIVHDDWSSTVTSNRGGLIGGMKRRFARRMLGPVYRQAVSRLCVSPNMVEQYQRWFGAGGEVLYPNRGDDSPEARIRVRESKGDPPVVAYCGLIHQAGTAHLLRELAAVLAAMGGHLDYYGPYSAEFLASNWHLKAPTVRTIGFLPSAEMGERLGETAHALFLPASFEPRERDDVATLFPSKLADYTAIGLPILVWGPAYSSAARWALEHPGATAVVTDVNGYAVEAVLRRLVTDPEEAARLAGAAITAGAACFDLQVARGILYRSLIAKEFACKTQ